MTKWIVCHAGMLVGKLRSESDFQATDTFKQQTAKTSIERVQGPNAIDCRPRAKSLAIVLLEWKQKARETVVVDIAKNVQQLTAIALKAALQQSIRLLIDGQHRLPIREPQVRRLRFCSVAVHKIKVPPYKRTQGPPGGVNAIIVAKQLFEAKDFFAHSYLFPLDSGKLWHFVRASREKSPCASPCPTPPLLTITPFPHLNAPLSAAVESDIVGYTTIEMQAGKWYQIGTPFVALEDANGQETLNDLLSTGFSDGDVAYIFDSATKMYSNAYTWDSSGNSGAGWYTGLLLPIPATEVVPPGSAIFIHKLTNGTVAFKGKVQSGVEVSLGSDSGDAWDQIVCVYPKDCSVNDIEWSNMNVGDELHVYDPESGFYESYTWDVVNEQPGWYSGVLIKEYATKVIPIGQGMFVNKKSKGKGFCSNK